MFPLYHHRVDYGPFYFVIDFSALAFGIWFYIEPDKSVAIEVYFFCWAIGVNLFDPAEEEEEV